MLPLAWSPDGRFLVVAVAMAASKSGRPHATREGCLMLTRGRCATSPGPRMARGWRASATTAPSHLGAALPEVAGDSDRGRRHDARAEPGGWRDRRRRHPSPLGPAASEHPLSSLYVPLGGYRAVVVNPAACAHRAGRRPEQRRPERGTGVRGWLRGLAWNGQRHLAARPFAEQRRR